MKKKIAIISVAIIAMTIFIAVQSIINDKPNIDSVDRTKEPYYIERISAEGDMRDQGDADAKAVLDELKAVDVNLQTINEKVKSNLQYCLDNFSEMRKGDNADIEQTKKISYSLSLIYCLVINCDYDGGYTHTELEKRLWKTKVYRYIDIAYEYFGDCNSLTQEEADFIETNKRGDALSKNLDEEVEVFINTLQLVITEAKEQEWI